VLNFREKIEVELDQFYSDIAPAEDFVIAREELEGLLALLGDPFLQTILTMRVQACTIDEIACHLGLVPRTIKRKLGLIGLTYDEYRRAPD